MKRYFIRHFNDEYGEYDLVVTENKEKALKSYAEKHLNKTTSLVLKVEIASMETMNTFAHRDIQGVSSHYMGIMLNGTNRTYQDNEKVIEAFERACTVHFLKFKYATPSGTKLSPNRDYEFLCYNTWGKLDNATTTTIHYAYNHLNTTDGNQWFLLNKDGSKTPVSDIIREIHVN